MFTDDTNSCLYQYSDYQVDQSVDGTSNPKSLETYSVFGDGSCGEPLFAQHVSIDFTPNDEIDNDFVQKKVCSFWQFINSTPEIQNLKVKPEKNVFTDTSSTTNVTETARSESEDNKTVNVVVDRTAVDMLVFAEEKNLIDRIFEAKMPMSNCTLGSREYKEGEAITRPKKKERKKHVCRCKTVCPKCPVHAVQMNKKASADELSPIRILSRRLNEWDAKHPKSMDPPGHAPPLQHCIIQRQVFPTSP